MMLAFELGPEHAAENSRRAQVVCVARSGLCYRPGPEWRAAHAYFNARHVQVSIRTVENADQAPSLESREESDRRLMKRYAQAQDEIEIRGLPAGSTPPFWISFDAAQLTCLSLPVIVDFRLRNLWEVPDVRAAKRDWERLLELTYERFPEWRPTPEHPELAFRQWWASAESTQFDGDEWLPVEVPPTNTPAVLQLAPLSASPFNARLILSAEVDISPGALLVRCVHREFEDTGQEIVVVARLLGSGAND